MNKVKITSNLLKLIFLSSFVQSESYISDWDRFNIEYFNEEYAIEINASMEDIKRNKPVQDSWTKKSEYQELLNAYKNKTKSTSRIYKIKLPIEVGCSYGYKGACFNVENERLEFRNLENYLKSKFYTKKGYYEKNYEYKKFRGKNRLSIPRDFLKDNFDILTLNAYIKFDIKDLVFNSEADIIEIIDLILSDEDNNIVLSTNFSYLIDSDSKESTTILDKNNQLEIDNSKYIEDSMELELIDIGDISEIVSKSKKLKKARSLSSSTAKKINKVYEALEMINEKGESAPDMTTVISILSELRNNQSSLSSYDRSIMWNAWAYVYYSQEKYDQAIQAYKYVIIEPEVTLPLRNTSLYTLSQLNIAQENYISAIKLLLLWMEQVETVTAESYYLLAVAYYQIEYYESAMDSINFAISIAELEGYEPSENWYALLDASTLSIENANKQAINQPIIAKGSFFKDTEYIPLFKVIPIYPRRAQERGTMGYALVEFTISETGVVEDAKTIEGYCSNSNPLDSSAELRPCTIFNSASARAALKLKYKPKIIDGKAVPIGGVIHKFTYIMEE